MVPSDVAVSENRQLSADPLPFARSYAYLLRKSSPYIAVFLVPTVVLVTQQGDALMMHTDLKVGKYWGEIGVGYWDAATWQHQVDDHEEFYHLWLTRESAQLPRIFGMTASPIKSKGFSMPDSYWQKNRDLENLMNSKAAEFLSHEEIDFFSWGELDVYAQSIVRDFSLDASKVFGSLTFWYHRSDWSIGGDILVNTDAGYLTSKANWLLESLLEYRDLKDLRCIIFVERIITAIILRSLLNELLLELSGWRTEYITGHLWSSHRVEKYKIKLLKNFARGW
ncbi:Dicer-like protein 2 [Datura stramonium]|uniref:Dicer-like protein 2 n=1 Tax=Datura stramonium TaxID=4076 RepID=A0ABS8SV34_DATST|nr:Dicer-like protein 2 [Datura stramonium]